MKLIRFLLCSASVGMLLLSAYGKDLSDAKGDSVSYHFVLVEEFGGTWCNSCVSVADSLSALHARMDNLATIGYHMSETRPEVSFLYNMDAYRRSTYYDTIRSLPTVFVNGKKLDKTGRLGEAVEEERLKKTPYELEMSVSHYPDRLLSRDSFAIGIQIRRIAPDTVRRLRLHIAFTQDRFSYNWFTQTEVNHALTFMYPNGEGTEVELDPTGSASFSFAFGIDYAKSCFPVKNGSITAFIQDQTVVGYDTLHTGTIRPVRDNTVLQARQIYLGEGAYTVVEDGEVSDPDFQNRNPEIADGGTARFYDNTFAMADSRRWEFEGGDPAESEEENPVVRYPLPGRYAATLSVTRNGVERSIRKENVISVLDVHPKFRIVPAVAKPNRNIKISLISEADSCRWTFFGGSPFSGSGKEISVSYPNEGSYDVRATVFYKSPVTGTSYTFDTTARNVIEIRKDAATGTADSQIAVQVRETRPGSHRFVISGADGMEYAEVFSVNGNRLIRTAKTEFDLSSFPSGLYIVNIKMTGKHPVACKISK